MSQATTLTLLPQTPFNNVSTVIGNKQPAAAYYLGNKFLQTLTWTVAGATATIAIQATLAENPIDTDWFTVYTIPAVTLTESNYENIQGNFVWLRAVVTGFSVGTIQNVKVSY